MSDSSSITAHYSRGGLLDRLHDALVADGADPMRPTLEQLSPYDQFHGRGLEATVEAASLMPAKSGDRVLDIGSGLGGPARWFARHFGCHVMGVDLTAEFCAVASELSRRCGLASAVEFLVADALTLPMADASFDGAYSMNVSMNIADKARFYREVFRVLKAGGWLLLSEVARGPGPDLAYPTPWAANSAASFLATPAETRAGLEAVGFEILHLESTRAKALDFGARSRAAVARGERPPHRSVMLVHGDNASAAMSNSAKANTEHSIDPIEVLARKPG
jgi:ubiquinone/menaquinone biosynthesis C-methylase UbiE